jgi:hypothetical protein
MTAAAGVIKGASGGTGVEAKHGVTLIVVTFGTIVVVAVVLGTISVAVVVVAVVVVVVVVATGGRLGSSSTFSRSSKSLTITNASSFEISVS